MKVISFIRECPDEVLAEFLAAYVSSCVHGALNDAGIGSKDSEGGRNDNAEGS